MFDPTCVVYNGRHVYVVRHEGCDYHRGAPISVKLNPLRYSITVFPGSARKLMINPRGRWAVAWANLIFRLRDKSDA